MADGREPEHGELTDAELWRCVAATVHDVLLPAIDDGATWSRAVAVQLVGLARYAAARPADRTGERVAEVATVLERLAGAGAVEWNGDRSPAMVMEAAGHALSGAIGRSGPTADAVRSELRPILVRQIDDELAITGPLVDAFRGRLDDD